MQDYFVSNLTEDDRKQILGAQLALLEQCARLDVPVVALEYEGQDKTVGKLRRSIEKVPRSVTIRKKEDDGFVSTALHQQLQEFGTTYLIVTGINASFCVLRTVQSALDLGYEVVTSENLIADARHLSKNDKRKEWYLQHTRFLPSVSLET